MLNKQNKKLKVLMASAEASPLVKIGGLADVVGSLPTALNKLACDVRVIIPKYKQINDKKFGIKKICSNISFNFAGKEMKINIYETKKAIKGTTVYLIEDDKYFIEEGVYRGNKGEDYLFFSQAVLEFVKSLKWKPDVIHSHDYHTGFIPALLKTDKFPELKGIKTLYTIHNLGYQGKNKIDILKVADLNKESLPSFARDAHDGDINFMVQGIVNADLVNTVSPTYAKEIMTKEYGSGLEKITKKYKNKLSGILNGIDIASFNPEKDKAIKKKYSSKTIKDKSVNKKYLQNKLNLPANDKPLVGFIGRLAYQKGIELFDDDLIKDLDCQFVFLGTGDKKYEEYLQKLAKKYPDKVNASIMFDMNLAREIYAGCDVIAVPSKYEPCGLIQMISMHYGTIPVARDTGGLADTINADLGFKFKQFSAKSFKTSLKKAINLYYNKPKDWLKLQKNCLKKDFSWNNYAKDYKNLYKKLK